MTHLLFLLSFCCLFVAVASAGQSCGCPQTAPCRNAEGHCAKKVRLAGEKNSTLLRAYCAESTTDCSLPQPFRPGDKFSVTFSTTVPYQSSTTAVQDTSAGLQYENNTFGSASFVSLTDLHGTSYSWVHGPNNKPRCIGSDDGLFTPDFFPPLSMYHLKPHFAEKVRLIPPSLPLHPFINQPIYPSIHSSINPSILPSFLPTSH